MNTVAIIILMIGLIGIGVGVYGYYNNQNTDDQKKRVYTGIGITASIVLLIGVFMLFMKKSSSTNSKNELNSLPNNPDDIVKMENTHRGIMDTIQAKKQKLVSNLETKLKMRGGESYM